MGPRATIVSGLAAGMAAAVLLLGLAVALLPDPGAAAPTAGVTATPGSSVVPGTTIASGGPTAEASIGTAAFHVGEAAPALRVPQLGGGEVDLANLAGRPVWINFMQTVCPPCVDELPLMNGFAARYTESGLVILVVDVREDEGTVADFMRSLGVNLPVGLDQDGAAASAWDAVALPTHLWIDGDGIIRAGALGGIGPDIMAEHLQVILPGVEVTP